MDTIVFKFQGFVVVVVFLGIRTNRRKFNSQMALHYYFHEELSLFTAVIQLIFGPEVS